MIKTKTTQPPSLKIFFATEMWERYGFYVVQTLLALYLSMYFGWDDDKIYPLVGSFTALTYLSPVIGGWIADHLLGQKKSVVAGIVILFLSYLALGLLESGHGLTFSLAGIAVGTGLLKPNISSLLGNEYQVGSPNRERGFTIFYMGITSGIILGTTLPSYLQSYFSWGVAFWSATVGMIIACFVFVFGIRYYQVMDYADTKSRFLDVFYALLLIIFLWVFSYYVLYHPSLAEALFALIALFSTGYLINALRNEKQKQARNTIVIGLLCLISIMFWSFYFQMFLSLTLFLKRVVQPDLFGIPFPPPYYVAIQSAGMIVFGLFLGRNKKRTSHGKQTIAVGRKFLSAMFFMSAAYLLITWIAHHNQDNSLLSPLQFIPAYLMISVAELLLSPVGLSAITTLSSPHKVSTMMGIFFVSLGLGGFLSGKLASLTAISAAELESLSIAGIKAHYATSFTHLLYILLVATFLCIIINWVIRCLMQPYK